MSWALVQEKASLKGGRFSAKNIKLTKGKVKLPGGPKVETTLKKTGCGKKKASRGKHGSQLHIAAEVWEEGTKKNPTKPPHPSLPKKYIS